MKAKPLPARRHDEILCQLNRMEAKIMATWQDVKDAADKQAATDAKVVAFLVDIKAKVADLEAKIAALPAGPAADEMQAVVDELNKGVDDVVNVMEPVAPTA